MSGLCCPFWRHHHADLVRPDHRSGPGSLPDPGLDALHGGWQLRRLRPAGLRQVRAPAAAPTDTGQVPMPADTEKGNRALWWGLAAAIVLGLIYLLSR